MSMKCGSGIDEHAMLSILSRGAKDRQMGHVTNLSKAKDLLDSMKDEVRDLHPVLSIVFPKLPTVKECEYTHGRDEWGADFVLTVEDMALGGVEHVGVIAKRGPIKQDLRSVDQQIEECRLKNRKVRGGINEIEIDRIWIVASGSISNNAKEKIYHKYKSTGISFIDGSKLASLIAQHTPFIGDNVAPEISEYLKRLRTKLEERRERKDMLAIDGEAPEIELEIVELKRDTDGHARQEPVKISEIVDRTTGTMVLEGRAGAGKTRELEKLASRYATNSEFKRTDKLPVLLPARELREKYVWDVNEAIEGELGRSAYGKLREEKSGILLLVDGMDEIPEESEEKRDIVERVRAEMSKEWTHYCVVITTRTGEELFLGQEIGIRELYIKSVTLRKLLKFILETCRHVSMPARIAEDLKKSDLFRQLPQNPIAAVLLSKVIREEGKELPSSLTEIYSKATELMLGRWDQQKGIVQEKEYLVVRYVMERIAKKMVDNGMWEVERRWIEEEFSEFIQERKLSISKEKVVQQALRRTGILVENSQRMTVEFKHMSFMEFLYASGWEPDEEERREKMYKRGWSEIYFFYIGLQRHGERFLSEALTLEETTMPGRWMKVMVAPAYMMAGWTAPYRIVEENLAGLVIDAAKVLLYLRDEREEDVADDLTEVQLLYLVQA